MRRLLVLLLLLAGLLVVTLPAQAAPSLSIAGSCGDSTVVGEYGQRFTGTMTDYYFVQVGETEIGLAGTVAGTCELLPIGGGEILRLPFAAQQVTLAPASWSLDCASHQFSFSAFDPTRVITQGTMWITVYATGTLSGTTAQQNKDICKAADKLDKHPPTTAKETADAVQTLNDLLADF